MSGAEPYESNFAQAAVRAARALEMIGEAAKLAAEAFARLTLAIEDHLENLGDEDERE